MNNKLTYIETEKRNYPIVFNINVMEEFQEAYGSFAVWGNLVGNENGEEPKLKDLKIGLMFMINEGIDIENEEKGEHNPMLTEKQVGRLISEVGFEEITSKMKNLIVESTNTGDNEGKNE